jgi:hypothetical protein
MISGGSIGGWVGSSPLMTGFITKNTVAKTLNHRKIFMQINIFIVLVSLDSHPASATVHNCWKMYTNAVASCTGHRPS